MQKIKFIVDSPSDIPDGELERYRIDMLSVPINIDGKEYLERRAFTIEEFYQRLQSAAELPTTSRIPVAEYVVRYAAAWEQGYTDIINVTINAGGSGIYDSASMAIKAFFHDHPEAEGRISIHMVNSKSYAMGYGYPTVQAAVMAEQGKQVPQILEYLRDYFDRLEIYLACYSLEYAKKSGRITAAAAFVGDVLGLRPIIAMIDGQTRTAEKVRGDKQVIPKLVELYRQRRDRPESPVVAICGAADEYGEELKALLERETGRPTPLYKAGASITINAGPKIAAICVLGKKRGAK